MNYYDAIRLSIVLWGVLCCQILAAQLPVFHGQEFGAQNGLDVGRISIVFKDRQQFLWVASDVSIQRFDGRIVYKQDFEHTILQALHDPDNRIWVLEGQKIWRSETNRWGFKAIEFDTLNQGLPYLIFQLPGRPISVIAKKGFSEWNEKTQRFQQVSTALPAPSFAPGHSRMDICGTTLFYPGKDVFYAVDVTTGHVRTLPRTKPFATICALTPDLAAVAHADGYSFWLDFSKGVTVPMDAVKYKLNDRIHRLNLMDAEPIGDSLFMVTSRFGPCTYDLRKDSFVRHRIFSEGKPMGLTESFIRIFRDDDGTFWAYSSSSLVAFSSIRNTIGLLRNFSDDPDQSWSNRVIGFTEDKPGNIWFGGFNGFNKIDTKTGQIEIHPPEDDAPDRLNHISVRGMAYDGHYIILGPTLKGIWLYEPERDRFLRPRFASDSVRSRIETEFIHGIYTLHDGNFLICGRSQAYLLDGKTHLLEFMQFPGSDGNIQIGYQDTQGRIWISTLAGFTVLDRDYRYLFKIPIENEQVISITQHSENEMLIGTSKGLRIFSPADEHGKVSKVEGPLEDVTIILIHRDRLQRYWFGTDNGIYLLDAQLKGFRHFDFADNIQSTVYFPFSMFQASNGLLFFGGRNGINYFYPEDIELKTKPLAVTLQTIAMGVGDSVIWNPGNDLVFEAGQNTLTIEVVVPYYNNAGKLQYRYRLAMGSPWINTGGSYKIRLTDLPPGDYQLEVAASVEGGLWYASEPLHFRINPEFWQYPAFQAGMAVLALGLVYFVFRRRENMLRKKQQQSLELEKHKTTALQYELEMEQVVNYFSRSIAQTNTVEEALWDVTQQCIARLGLEDCVIYLLDQDRNVLLQKAAWGSKSSPDQKIINPIEVPVGKGIVGTVAKTGAPELIADTTADPRYIPDGVVRLSELAVPILEGDQVIGVIDSEHSQRHFYTSRHLNLLTAIASLCSNKIALARSEEARRQALLETLNSQRKAAEAKLQSLRLQMKPHFLFNALNSIQELILTGNSDGAAMYLSKFSKLLRMILMHSDQELLSLREEIGILELYLELESLRFYDTFAYKIECEPGLDLDEYKLPTLLVQPFVENAIWHGLLHKKGMRNLSIRFETDDDDALVCTVEDNGIGRAAASKINSIGGHTGKGVSSSAERLHEMSSRNGRKNTLEIIDLTAKDGTSTGTCVRITIT